MIDIKRLLKAMKAAIGGLLIFGILLMMPAVAFVGFMMTGHPIIASSIAFLFAFGVLTYLIYETQG